MRNFIPNTIITVTSQWDRVRLKSPASMVYPTVNSVVDQKKHQSSASLAFVRGIHRWLVNSPHKGSDAENFSIWWRHHGIRTYIQDTCLSWNTIHRKNTRNMDYESQESVRWNYFSIPKLQPCNCWNLVTDRKVDSTLYSESNWWGKHFHLISFRCFTLGCACILPSWIICILVWW